MPGLFSRATVWKRLQEVTAAALNAEFNNIIANMIPSKIDDFSQSVAQMQLTADPGSVGEETQAASLAEEIQQLRFMIAALSGEDQWYTTPDVNLSDLNSLFLSSIVVPENRIISGKVDANRQPVWLDPAGSSAGVTLDSSTDLEVMINGTRRVFEANITLSGLSLAPSSNNTALVNYPGLASFVGNFEKVLGETLDLPIDNIGSEIQALDGKLCAFKIVHSAETEYFVAEVDYANSCLKNARRGFFFGSTQAWVPRIDIDDNDVITLLKLTWVFAIHDGTTASLGIAYNQPKVAYDQPTSPATGDFWLDLSVGRWKKYSGAGWDEANAVFIGYCAQDSSNCIAARAADLFKAFSEQSSITLEKTSSSTISTKKVGSKISVYGSQFFFETSKITWDTSLHMDGSLSTNDLNYLYMTDQGDLAISQVAPYDRTIDLFGYYHPAKPWRAVGSFFVDNASAIQDDISVYDDPAPTYDTNILYNGKFLLWQRGSSTTVTNGNTGYLADRWYAKNSLGTDGVITYSREALTSNFGQYYAKLLISTAPTAGQTNGCELYQSLAAFDSIHWNKKLDFNVMVRGFGNVNKVGIQLFYKSTEGKVDTAIGEEIQVNVGTTAFTSGKISGVQTPFLTGLTQSLGVRIRIVGVSSGNLYDVNNGFGIMNACLAPEGYGQFFPSFRGGSYAAELEGCQRFYEKSYPEDTAPGTTSINGYTSKTQTAGTDNYCTAHFRVTKHKDPTIATYSTATGTVAKIRDFTDNVDLNSLVVGAGRNAFTEKGSLNGAGPNHGGFHWTADAEL